MSGAVGGCAFVPFFLPAQRGERFCIFHPPEGVPRGGVVYIPPFAEEMHKSRRMAALQSRALAALGYAVLQMDLYGCGDSSGDFGDASWETWRQDVALGMRWIRERACSHVTFWGLRLGALLALDAARLCDPLPERFVLWQPVLTGEALLTQFLRLRLASEMLSESSTKTGVRELRASLAAGSTLEVGGYALAPSLALPMDGLRLADLQPAAQRVHWFEVVPDAGRELSPAARRVADAWTRGGAQLSIQCVPGMPFWSTVEIAECPALIAATLQVLAEAHDER